jgi:hypothetical protein
MTRVLLCLPLLVLAMPATASTPAAWNQLNRKVDRACRAAAGLQRTTIVADRASFPDAVPIELRVVEGYNRGGVIDVKLCAFNRRTGRVAITDGVGRLGVNRR